MRYEAFKQQSLDADWHRPIGAIKPEGDAYTKLDTHEGCNTCGCFE